MTVRMPGEECLTKTQEAQRAFRKKLIEKSQTSPSTAGAVNQFSSTKTFNQELASAVEPSTRSDTSLAVNKYSSRGQLLSVSV